MKIDITPILSGKVKTLPFAFEIPTDGEDAPLPPIGVELSSPVRVKGRLSDSGSCVMLRLTAEADFKAPCDRCAEETSGTVTCRIERVVAEDSVLTEDAGEDDYFVACDGNLELDSIISEELMLSFPTQILCREDCRGVCPACGQNLNLGDCGCESKKSAEIDPRWQSLQKLLERENEDQSR